MKIKMFHTLLSYSQYKITEIYHNHTIKSYIFIIYGYQMFGEHCLFLVAWFKNKFYKFSMLSLFCVWGFFFSSSTLWLTRRQKNSCPLCLPLWRSYSRRNKSCWSARGRSRKKGRRRWTQSHFFLFWNVLSLK